MATVKDDDREDTRLYKVVVNSEEQYSIWPADRENPRGWQDTGPRGPRTECLRYIEQVWTDMRPRSLRTPVQPAAKLPVTTSASREGAAESHTGDELVDRLCEGNHPVEVVLRPEKTAQRLKQNIDRGYVYIKFTATGGGTELGVTLDRERCDLTRADFARQAGTMLLVGALTLNDVRVRCVARIDVPTLMGHGQLEPMET
jgi:uncharacterized protein YbdZ (MbtH family)